MLKAASNLICVNLVQRQGGGKEVLSIGGYSVLARPLLEDAVLPFIMIMCPSIVPE